MADNAEHVRVLEIVAKYVGRSSNIYRYIADELAISPAAVGEEKVTAYVMDPGAGSGCDRLIFARSRSFYESDVKSRGGSFTPLYTRPQPQGVAGDERIRVGTLLRPYPPGAGVILKAGYKVGATTIIPDEAALSLPPGEYPVFALHPPTREGQPDGR